MIKELAERLISRKFRDVRADHPEFTDKPACITLENSELGQLPDVTATGIQMVLFEVETADTIYHPHTEQQWEVFSSYAENNGADFWVVVPREQKSCARERLSSLGLKAKVMVI